MSNPIKLGFIVVSEDDNHVRIRTTVKSIEAKYSEREIICVVPQSVSPERIKEIEKICRVVQGKKSLVSLINAGMETEISEWNCVVISGSYVPKSIDKKIGTFLKGEKDVFFPVSSEAVGNGTRKFTTNFMDASLNGITLRCDTFKKIGKFSENPLEISKFFWMLEAIDQGCQFKGILGII